MNRRNLLCATAAGLAGCAITMPSVSASDAHVQAALADPRRPQADRDRDPARKPAEMLAFAGVRPGMRIMDLIPGGGYFTRMFAVAVGPTGRVFSVSYENPPQQVEPQPIHAVAAAYPNVSVSLQDLRAPRFKPNLDLVWISQDYHDFLIPGMQQALHFDPDAIDRAIFGALRPGGVFVVVDHSAVDGSGIADSPHLHRVDQAAVRARLEAAGFVFDGATEVLRNPEDTRTVSVFDASIRGRTDQFVMRFRKPMR